jgi:antitoxin YefM
MNKRRVNTMKAVNYSYARENFKKICDEIIEDFETFIITRKNGGNVVLISEVEYNKMIKSIYGNDQINKGATT